MHVTAGEISIREYLGNTRKDTRKQSVDSKEVQVFNVFTDATLPVIKVKFGESEQSMLLDSGSTISLISHNSYTNIKQHTKVRLLSRNVSIRTVNSNLSFICCAEMSFKIGKHFFKHVFYVTEFVHNEFHGILGFDFISKQNIVLLPKEHIAQFDNFEVPFLSKPSQQANSLLASSSTSAKLTHKIVLEPNETAQVTVNTGNFITEPFFLFEPSVRDMSIEIHPSIHIANGEDKFTTVIKNIGLNTIHLNKSTVIGHCTNNIELEDKESIDNSVDCADSFNCGDKHQPLEFCNLVTPSPDILRLRKQELKASDFDLDHLTTAQKQEMLKLLLSNSAAFSKSLQTLGCTDRVVPKISFRSTNPIKTLPFEIPHALQDNIKKELLELQEAGLIHRNIAEWACPMLLVKKKPDAKNPSAPPKYRMALDLRLLNSVIEHSTYPLPKISNLINEVSTYKFYSVLDLKNAYWQVLLPEELQDVLTFTTPFGTFANRRMVFGLKTAASTFQALVDLLIDELRVEGIIGVHAYQDDILIGAADFNDMMHKVTGVLNIMSKYNITLSPSKCVFFKTSIDYLGFNISHKHIKPISTNIAKVTKFQSPKTVRQVKKFLGLCGFYRNLIPEYARLTDCLSQLTSKSTKFKWTSEHQAAFEQLQQVFFSEPFVTLPQWDKPFILNTDASGTAISGVLMQESEGTLHPISYYSRSLSNSERNYPAIKLELFAIYKAVTSFKSYLYNRKFTVLTDSKPLLHYKKTSSPADIVTRWLLELSEYSFSFKHIPGKINILADYLSRMQDPSQRIDVSSNGADGNEDSIILPFVDSPSPKHECFNLMEAIEPEFEIDPVTFRLEQLKDPDTGEIIKTLNTSSLAKAQNIKEYFIHGETGLLMLRQNRSPNNEVLVVPKSLRAKVLNICHSLHFGLQKTYEILTQRYFWKGAYTDTKNFVLSCDQCIRHKPFSPVQAPLVSLRIPQTPGDFISMDILGPIKDGGYTLTILDHFSKHMALYPLKNITAESVTTHVINYISNYGRPSVILSDLGTQFTSEVFNLVNNALGIKLVHSTSKHPESNGQSERINGAIKSSINILREDGVSFANALLLHQHLYNGTVHSSTGFTPNLLHFGRNHALFFDTFNPNVQTVFLDKSHFAADLLSQLKTTYETAYSNLERAQVEQNSRHAQNAKLRKFNIGDIVYLKSKDKFKPRFAGPFTVVEKNNDVNYTIRLLDNPYAESFKIHINRLRLAPSRSPHLIQPVKLSHMQPSKHQYNLRNR